MQKSNPDYNPPIPQPSPSKILDDGVQIVLSDYSANSLSYSLFAGGYLNFNITNGDLPSDFPIPLTTTTIGFFIPDLIDLYGFGEEITIYCNFDQPPLMKFLNSSD